MKQVKIYGTAKKRVTITRKQRYWKTRKDGIRQRYWKKTTFKQAVGKYEKRQIYVKKEDIKEKVKEEYEEYKWEEFKIKSP